MAVDRDGALPCDLHGESELFRDHAGAVPIARRVLAVS